MADSGPVGTPDNMAEKNVRHLVYRASVSLLDLLFPPRCHICAGLDVGAASRTTCICDGCFSQLAFIASPLCKRCGCPFEMSAQGHDHHCPACLKKLPAYDTARSLLRYQAPVKDLLHRLKYRADSSVVGPIREIIAHNGKIWKQETCDLIIPVPLHAARLKKRGMNQSHLLARLAFPADQEKIAINLLERVKNTNPQTGLNGTERRRNLNNAFHVTSPGRIGGTSVWLVDDVFTTGTTVSECSKTLKKNGAREVHVWTFARV